MFGTNTSLYVKEDGIGHDSAVRMVREDVAEYKKQLEKPGPGKKLLVKAFSRNIAILNIKKQYTGYGCDDYMD